MTSRRIIAHRLWDIIITVAATAAALDIPARLVLGQYRRGEAITDWAITLLFCIDVVVRHGRRGPAGAASGGDGGIDWRWLAADIAAALPVQLLGVGSVLQILRLAKLARIGEFMRRWRLQTAYNANKLRLAFFAFWLALSAHCITCGWLGLRGIDPSAPGESYLRALYWCVTTLTTVGYGDITPSTSSQTLYAMLVMIIGVGIYGYVIGNVATILSNIDPARAEYLAHMERLNSFMRYRKIPPALQRRIRDYYDYIWEKRLSYDESEIISDLPPGLGSEVSLFLKRDIIQKVPIFKEASEAFIREIALQLRPVVYMPGDYIIRAGEPGREMFFINQGTVEVVSREGDAIYATHTDGDFFGEIALFEGVPRTASVRTVSYCDLYRLDKEMFEHVLAHYPEIASHIQTLARERRERG